MDAQAYLNRYHKDAEATATDETTIEVIYNSRQDGHTRVSSYKLINAAKRKGYTVVVVR